MLPQLAIAAARLRDSRRRMLHRLAAFNHVSPTPLLFGWQAFFFDVVSKEDAVTCKHQLAARLADALGKARVQTVSDAALALLLQE